MIRFVGKFEDIKIYEWALLGEGYNAGGLALPGIGIFVGIGCHSQGLDEQLIYHEYGHFLQAKEIGWLQFYAKIGVRSLLSARNNGYGHGHQNYWTELWANALVNAQFPKKNLDDRRFPAKNISKERLAKLKSPFHWLNLSSIA